MILLQYTDNSLDLTSDTNSGVMPQIYYTPFAEQNLSMPMMDYQYSISERTMDLTYMLAEASANVALSQNLPMDEPAQARQGLQNRHTSVMSSVSPPPLFTPALLHQSPMQIPPQATSFPTAITSGHMTLPPADPPNPASKSGADVR